MSPTVPAALRQEIVRVLRENAIESKGSHHNKHCGVVAFGQSSVLKEGQVIVGTEEREEGEEGEEGEDNEEERRLSNYPRPCLHTYPWVVETNVPASLRNASTEKSYGAEEKEKGKNRKKGMDWTGWHRHYNVYLYRTSAQSFERFLKRLKS